MFQACHISGQAVLGRDDTMDFHGSGKRLVNDSVPAQSSCLRGIPVAGQIVRGGNDTMEIALADRLAHGCSSTQSSRVETSNVKNTVSQTEGHSLAWLTLA